RRYPKPPQGRRAGRLARARVVSPRERCHSGLSLPEADDGHASDIRPRPADVRAEHRRVHVYGSRTRPGADGSERRPTAETAGARVAVREGEVTADGACGGTGVRDPNTELRCRTRTEPGSAARRRGECERGEYDGNDCR